MTFSLFIWPTSTICFTFNLNEVFLEWFNIHSFLEDGFCFLLNHVRIKISPATCSCSARNWVCRLNNFFLLLILVKVFLIIWFNGLWYLFRFSWFEWLSFDWTLFKFFFFIVLESVFTIFTVYFFYHRFIFLWGRGFIQMSPDLCHSFKKYYKFKFKFQTT